MQCCKYFFLQKAAFYCMEWISFLFYKYSNAYTISTPSVCKKITKLLHISLDYWGELYSLLSGLFVHFKLFGNQLSYVNIVIYRKKFLRLILKPASLKAMPGTFNQLFSESVQNRILFPEFFWTDFFWGKRAHDQFIVS